MPEYLIAVLPFEQHSRDECKGNIQVTEDEVAGNICLRKTKPFPVFDVRNQFYPHSNLNDNPLWVSAVEPQWHCSLHWSP